MPRRKLSEFKSKSLLFEKLGVKYSGQEINKSSSTRLADKKYVVKVDQAVKKRAKSGLLKLDRSAQQAKRDIEELLKQGFDYLLVEEYIEHQPSSEKFLSLSLNRNGLQLLYSQKGGIDIEDNQESISRHLFRSRSSITAAATNTGLDEKFLKVLVEFFNENYLSSIEINPLIIHEGSPWPLDIAAEVDDAAMSFVTNWGDVDLRNPRRRKDTKQELAVKELNDKSPASFNLEVLNANGSMFMLLSGGGASVTIADEVHNQGLGALLANYGEYSGAPSREETAYYAKNIIELMLKSKSKNKVLIIAGGVANFTDVQATFKGIIDSLSEYKAQLKKHKVEVYVRRGGPNELKGLEDMEKFISGSKLTGKVFGSDVVLTDVVSHSIRSLT